jgi:hypothetical protein
MVGLTEVAIIMATLLYCASALNAVFTATANMDFHRDKMKSKQHSMELSFGY